jgi:Ca2+-binding RTX toxin-like protein
VLTSFAGGDAKGGIGNDTISIGDRRTGWGEDGDDLMEVISQENLSQWETGGVLFGGEGNDTLEGSNGRDKILGGSGNDSMDGGEGDDTLDGDMGEDHLEGGAGNDKLDGDLGADQLDGGDGDDYLLGGEGNDTLLAGDGRDTLWGEMGNDTFHLGTALRTAQESAFARTFVYGGSGNDTFAVAAAQGLFDADDATTGHATLHGGEGDDTYTLAHLESGHLYGGAGNDTMTASLDPDAEGTLILIGGAGDDVLTSAAGGDAKGGIGNDTIAIAHGQSGWGENGDDLLEIISQEGLSRWETGGVLFGGAGNDNLGGGQQSDTLRAGDGADTLDGGRGNDALFGGSGNDFLLGGNDADTLNGDAGDNTLMGGSGTDVFAIDTTNGTVLITDFRSETDRLRFDAAALDLGDGDNIIEGIAEITTPEDTWRSIDEVVLLRLGGSSVTAAQTANALAAAVESERIGDRNIVIAYSDADAFLFRHTADGADGVEIGNLEFLGIVENTTELAPGDVGFF